MQKQKYQAYAAATQTVARTRQIVMLYDGAVRYLQQGRDAMAAKRIEDRFNLLSKASDIVAGMQGCLDFEKGGEVAKALFSYYSSVNNRIFSLHRTNSLEMCDQVIADLKAMRDNWASIDQGESAMEASVPSSMPAAVEPVTLSA